MIMKNNEELYYYTFKTNELGTLLCYSNERNVEGKLLFVKEIFSGISFALSIDNLTTEFEKHKLCFAIPKRETLERMGSGYYFSPACVRPVEFLKELKHQQEEVYQNKSKEEISNIIKDKLRNIYKELHVDEISEKDAKIKILKFINSGNSR